MDNNLISIMMPAYNAEAFIGQAIESVFTQTYRKWELLMVNDGSTDNTLEIAHSFHDPRIKVINQPNGGEAAARNTALEKMQGSYVAFLDADDFFLDNHLKITMEYLQSHPQRDGVYTNGYYCDEKQNPIQTLQSWRRGPFEGHIFEEVVRASDVFGPPICVVLKRDLIEKHHLRFDPAITIGPDWDFFTRFSAYADFGYLDKITCCYRIHQTNITFRTGSSHRSLDLAKCRMKAIKLEEFDACSIDVKFVAFYDLLVNLLMNYPEQQSEIIQWDEFRKLPAAVQAKLLRLMASNLIFTGEINNHVYDWLNRSRQLNPNDLLGLLTSSLYKLSPKLCKWMLELRRIKIRKHSRPSPFGDLI